MHWSRFFFLRGRAKWYCNFLATKLFFPPLSSCADHRNGNRKALARISKKITYHEVWAFTSCVERLADLHGLLKKCCDSQSPTDLLHILSQCAKVVVGLCIILMLSGTISYDYSTSNIQFILTKNWNLPFCMHLCFLVCMCVCPWACAYLAKSK